MVSSHFSTVIASIAFYISITYSLSIDSSIPIAQQISEPISVLTFTRTAALLANSNFRKDKYSHTRVIQIRCFERYGEFRNFSWSLQCFSMHAYFGHFQKTPYIATLSAISLFCTTIDPRKIPIHLSDFFGNLFVDSDSQRPSCRSHRSVYKFVETAFVSPL